jgi:hypothetical protein
MVDLINPGVGLSVGWFRKILWGISLQMSSTRCLDPAEIQGIVP